MPGPLETVLSGIFSASFIAAILRITTPLLLPSLGALLTERAGVINIGLEGIMLAAAFTGATLGALTASPLIGLIAGLIAAIATALLLAFFHLGLNGDLILAGVAINILGSAATIAIGYQISGERTGALTNLPPALLPNISLPFLRSIPGIGEALYTAFGEQNLMVWVAFVAVAVVWFLLYRMPLGTHLRAVGENADAAASVGIPVRRTRYIALGLSGLLAGLGGVFMSMAYLSGFTRDMTTGRGYVALVIPALGGGTPGGTLIAALLYGTFAALETRLGGINLPSQIPQMIPYAATLLALVIYALSRRRAAAARVRRIETMSSTEASQTAQ